MGRVKTAGQKSTSGLRSRAVAIVEVGLVLPTMGWLAYAAARQPGRLTPILIAWAAIIAFVELLPVPFWKGIQISTGFPLLMALAFLYPAGAAGLTAFV